MKKYCFNCGAKWEFSPKNKPIFCSGCGKPTGLTVSSSTQEGEEEAEDGNDVATENWTPNIQGLTFDYDGDLMKPKKESLGSLMGTLDKGHVSQDFPTAPEISKEEAREQFKKEAGALRSNDKPSREDA